MLCHRETHIIHKEQISCHAQWGDHDVHTEAISSAASMPERLFVPHTETMQKHSSSGGADAALGNWQPVWNKQVLISICVY